MEQPTAKPHRKVAAGAVVGLPAGVLVVWLLSLAGVDVPPEPATAIGTLASFVAGYFVEAAPGDV